MPICTRREARTRPAVDGDRAHVCDPGEMIEAVIFDLDGVLIDSEQVWASAREQLVRERGGTWRSDAVRAMMGMSSPEWARYMHERLGLAMAPEQIAREVVQRLEGLYRERLPLIPGAREAVASLANRWRLGLASSANRPIIELVLELADMRRLFAVTVSAEEVARGKPAPDVYLEVARRLGHAPSHCAAVEDSTNGLRAAKAAGMLLVALPNHDFPPTDDALALADAVIESLDELRPELVERVAGSDHTPPA
jgi:HAD superfamily hydrolase (TIGR01509 family)